MMRLVRASSAEINTRLTHSSKNQVALRMREYALAKTAGKSVIAFVVGWSPYACLALAALSGHVRTLARVAAVFVVVVCVVAEVFVVGLKWCKRFFVF